MNELINTTTVSSVVTTYVNKTVTTITNATNTTNGTSNSTNTTSVVLVPVNTTVYQNLTNITYVQSNQFLTPQQCSCLTFSNGT